MYLNSLRRKNHRPIGYSSLSWTFTGDGKTASAEQQSAVAGFSPAFTLIELLVVIAIIGRLPIKPRYRRRSPGIAARLISLPP